MLFEWSHGFGSSGIVSLPSYCEQGFTEPVQVPFPGSVKVQEEDVQVTSGEEQGKVSPELHTTPELMTQHNA